MGERFGASRDNNDTITQVNAAVTNRGGLLAVGNQDERGPGFIGELAEKSEDVFAVRRIEISRRFIGKEQRGPMHERPRDGDALLFSAGKLRRQRVCPPGQADPLKQCGHPHRTFRCRDTNQLEWKLHVFRSGERGQEMKKLKNRAYPLPPEAIQPIGIEPVYSSAEQMNLAGIRPINATQTVKQGRLSASGRARERDPLATCNRERNVIEHTARTVVFNDTSYGKSGDGGGGDGGGHQNLCKPSQRRTPAAADNKRETMCPELDLVSPATRTRASDTLIHPTRW
jgi:hypothetical protein